MVQGRVLDLDGGLVFRFFYSCYLSPVSSSVKGEGLQVSVELCISLAPTVLEGYLEPRVSKAKLEP